jgi:uncharacterized coiled-coil protein SlyX
VTREASIARHDYRLEPPDEVIAELQSTVVQLRQRGARTRDELLEALLDAATALSTATEASAAVTVAALAIQLRMEAA